LKGHFDPPETAETPWFRGESGLREAVAGGIFLCVSGIAWESQGIRRNARNDAETIDLGFRPKMKSGLRMRPGAIVAASGHGAK
jgi:hypothetical protein